LLYQGQELRIALDDREMLVTVAASNLKPLTLICDDQRHRLAPGEHLRIQRQ
jgi:hypothetical protein